tara:strand:- start:180 stop:713 length:534 start_codon:yes stop_codon:yes gene_type:complete
MINSSIKVIDNVVSDIYQQEIEDLISSMEWYFLEGITFKKQTEDPHTGFVNGIFNQSDQIRKSQTDFLLPLLYEGISKYKGGAKLIDLYRIRAVMWIKNQNKGSHLPHNDLAIEHYNMVYYVNDTDAPTRLYKYDRVFKEIQPKKGRALIFPGNIKHSSASPTESNRRMVLNYNFLI